MIQVEMSKDIHDFSPKVIGMFDRRQLVCLLIAGLYGLPAFMLTSFLPIEFRLTLVTVLVFPTLACGWVKMYGMPLEKFAIHVFKFKFINPQKRKYATRNTFNYLSPQPAVPKDISKIKPEKLTRKEKKKWKKDMTRYGAVS